MEIKFKTEVCILLARIRPMEAKKLFIEEAMDWDVICWTPSEIIHWILSEDEFRLHASFTAFHTFSESPLAYSIKTISQTKRLSEKIKSWQINISLRSKSFRYGIFGFGRAKPHRTPLLCRLDRHHSYILLTPVITRRDLTYLEFFFSSACSFIYVGQGPDHVNIYGKVMSVTGTTKMKNKNYYRVKINPHFNCNFFLTNSYHYCPRRQWNRPADVKFLQILGLPLAFPWRVLVESLSLANINTDKCSVSFSLSSPC